MGLGCDRFFEAAVDQYYPFVVCGGFWCELGSIGGRGVSMISDIISMMDGSSESIVVLMCGLICGGSVSVRVER